MSKSDYLENKVLDLILGGVAFSSPATVYVALFTTTPSDAGGGVEVSGGSYARVSKVNNSTNWPAASGGAKSNGTEIAFPTATANWGTVVAFGIFDAASGGNLLYWGPISPSKSVPSGATARFPVGDLDITEA